MSSQMRGRVFFAFLAIVLQLSKSGKIMEGLKIVTIQALKQLHLSK